MSNLKCQYENHDESLILGICVDKKCKNSRVYCVACKFEFHKEHLDKLMQFGQLRSCIAQKYTLYQNLTFFNGTILQFQNQLNEALKLLNFNREIDIDLMSRTELNNLVNKMLVLEEIENQLDPQIKMLQQEMDTFKYKFKTALQTQDIMEEERVNEQQQKNHNIIEIQRKSLNRFQQPSEKIINTQNTQIEKNGKQASGIGQVLCDYLIPKTGVTVLSFKYVDGYSLGLGLCHGEKLIESNYKKQLTNKSHGFYLIQSNGICYSHLDSSINGKAYNGSFFLNDIITLYIKMEQQTITWIVNKKEVLTMNIDVRNDLYPIVDICGIVEIVDEC